MLNDRAQRTSKRLNRLARHVSCSTTGKIKGKAVPLCKALHYLLCMKVIVRGHFDLVIAEIAEVYGHRYIVVTDGEGDIFVY